MLDPFQKFDSEGRTTTIKFVNNEDQRMAGLFLDLCSQVCQVPLEFGL